MSHSTVLVIADDHELALAPFDENLEVERYVDDTRESLIANERERLAFGRERAAEYAAQGSDYRGASNTGHIAWITHEVPRLSAMSDAELWQEYIRPIYADVLDENNQTWSTYNPKSKWDWYVVGGRWDGGLVTTDGRRVNECLRRELDLEATSATFAVLDQEGTWNERGSMGWFGMVADEKAQDAWTAEWRRLLDATPADAHLTLVDVHI